MVAGRRTQWYLGVYYPAGVRSIIGI